MSQFVVTGASLQCTFGTVPSAFIATNAPAIICGGKPMGVLSDGAPGVNIMPFGMCTSLANPVVAAATAAALGVLTPQPCLPASSGNWIPESSKVLGGSTPCLTMGCKLMCMYGGVINVTNSGQTKVLG
jgi:hypothetical protein